MQSNCTAAAAESFAGLESAIEAAKKIDATTPAVEISTIHRSKGSEWENVFVCGVSDGLLPHKKAEDIVRLGVAPDHPNIKAVSRVFEKTAEKPGFRFLGNVEVGRDLHVDEARGARPATEDDVAGAIERLGRPKGSSLLAESEVPFRAELSVIVCRGVDGETAVYPIARNVHDAGILIESVAPAPIPEAVAAVSDEIVDLSEADEVSVVQTRFATTALALAWPAPRSRRSRCRSAPGICVARPASRHRRG